MAGESHKVSDVLAIRVGDGYIVGSVGCRNMTLTRRPIIMAILLANCGWEDVSACTSQAEAIQGFVAHIDRTVVKGDL